MNWPCVWVDLLGPCGINPPYVPPIPATSQIAREEFASIFSMTHHLPPASRPYVLVGLITMLVGLWVWQYLRMALHRQAEADKAHQRAVEHDAYDGGPMTFLETLNPSPLPVSLQARAAYWRGLAERHDRAGRQDWAKRWRGRAEALEMAGRG